MQLRHTELKDCSLWLRNYKDAAIEITQKTDIQAKGRVRPQLSLMSVNEAAGGDPRVARWLSGCRHFLIRPTRSRFWRS